MGLHGTRWIVGNGNRRVYTPVPSQRRRRRRRRLNDDSILNENYNFALTIFLSLPRFLSLSFGDSATFFPPSIWRNHRLGAQAIVIMAINHKACSTRAHVCSLLFPAWTMRALPYGSHLYKSSHSASALPSIRLLRASLCVRTCWRPSIFHPILYYWPLYIDVRQKVLLPRRLEPPDDRSVKNYWAVLKQKIITGKSTKNFNISCTFSQFFPPSKLREKTFLIFHFFRDFHSSYGSKIFILWKICTGRFNDQMIRAFFLPALSSSTQHRM